MFALSIRRKIRRKSKMKKVITQEVLAEIKRDGILFGKVADAAGLSPRSLVDLLRTERAATRLARRPVVAVLKRELKGMVILSEMQAIG